MGDCLEFEINEDTILCEGELTNPDSVREIANELIDFGHKDYERRIIIREDFNGVEREFTRARFEIAYWKNSIFTLQKVVEQIGFAFLDYKKRKSKEWYNISYEDLTFEQKDHLDSLVRFRIGFYRIDDSFRVPPPPPIEDSSNF